MAFAKPAVVAAIPDTNRAQAFINVWIPMADGSRHKLGALPLKASVAYQNGVIERLQAGGDDALKALLGVVQIDFKLANSEPVAASAVGF